MSDIQQSLQHCVTAAQLVELEQMVVGEQAAWRWSSVVGMHSKSTVSRCEKGGGGCGGGVGGGLGSGGCVRVCSLCFVYALYHVCTALVQSIIGLMPYLYIPPIRYDSCCVHVAVYMLLCTCCCVHFPLFNTHTPPSPPPHKNTPPPSPPLTYTHRIRHADSAPQLQGSSLAPSTYSWEDICTWVLGVSRYNTWDVLMEGAFMSCVQQRIDGWMEGVARAVLEPMTTCFEVCVCDEGMMM